MQTILFRATKVFTASCLVVLLPLVILFQGCKKSVPASEPETVDAAASRKPPKDPPPSPEPFYFSGCSNPATVPSLVAGAPQTINFTMSYTNSPGGLYATFTSATVNGVTISTPAGTLNVGSGSIVFTASGTPANTGYYNIPMSIDGSISCNVVITVTNAPASRPTADPGPTIGSTGVVNFIYKGQPVAYKTVRAKDGKIWLQQNLGSPQVAFHEMDQASYGDYFQWGRWDDGHQASNSPTITGGPSLLNPSNIQSGNTNFITGTTANTGWWSVGGLASDTWSGTAVSLTNGKDPCAALGTGWRLPTAAEWQNISIQEDLFGTLAAFQSNLKLPTAGYRLSPGGFVFQNGDIGYYWTSNAADNSHAKVFFFDNVYHAEVTTSARAQGLSCRCVKN